MKGLEAQLGLPLFERVGRNARLTPDGKQLVERLKPLQQDIFQALEELQQRHHWVEGELGVGSPRTFGAKWMRPRLQKLLRSHAQLCLTVEFDVPSVLEARLVEGALDIVILVRPTELPGLVAKPIATETFIAVCSPGYSREVSELQNARYIVFDDDLPMHQVWWRAQFGRQSPLRPRIAAKVASLDEMRALAESGVGIAVLPDYFVADMRGLTHIKTSAPPAKNTLFLCWRASQVETARFLAVRQALLPTEK
jgi:DNA-binding transcriptional LysR family regulator